MLTRRELWDTLHTAATSLYEGVEARAVVARLCEELFKMRFTDVVVEPEAACPKNTEQHLQKIVKELEEGRPIQYITGYTEFYGRRFTVREGVLIPRPETEELVSWVLEEDGGRIPTGPDPTRPDRVVNPLHILDIGTGSGCIAISLAAELQHSKVTASDISTEALAVAAENARLNQTTITLVLHDILQPNLPPEFEPKTFDMIISNPPYVTDREQALMRPNVLNYEPASALFVPDDDPLKFYRVIARHGRTLLRPGGALYFEINEQFGSEVLQLLRTEGYINAELRRDIFGKERMVRAWLN